MTKKRPQLIPKSRAGAIVLALLCVMLPAAVLADPTAATLVDRLMHTIYPEKGIPRGYQIPVATELPGQNPRQVQFAFTRTADQAVTLLRFDLYDDEPSLKKKYPYQWSKGGFDLELNPVTYRFGSYRASCSAHYSKTKAQIADVCDMPIGATVMDVATTFEVPPGTALAQKPSNNAFLDSIRAVSTAFVTNGATFYIEVGGLAP
jgi:hypothetical protein